MESSDSSAIQVDETQIRLLSHPNTKGFKKVEYRPEERDIFKCSVAECLSPTAAAASQNDHEQVIIRFMCLNCNYMYCNTCF